MLQRWSEFRRRQRAILRAGNAPIGGPPDGTADAGRAEPDQLAQPDVGAEPDVESQTVEHVERNLVTDLLPRAPRPGGTFEVKGSLVNTGSRRLRGVLRDAWVPSAGASPSPSASP